MSWYQLLGTIAVLQRQADTIEQVEISTLVIRIASATSKLEETSDFCGVVTQTVHEQWLRNALKWELRLAANELDRRIPVE